MIKGTTVQLMVDTVTGEDPFGAPIVEKVPVDIPDVLVGQPTTDDITASVQMYGKKIEYILGIPKGDTHDWTDAEVIIWGEPYRQSDILRRESRRIFL